MARPRCEKAAPAETVHGLQGVNCDGRRGPTNNQVSPAPQVDAIYAELGGSDRHAGPPMTATPDFTDYILSEFRCASLRARLLQLDIEAVGLALKGGLVRADQAFELLHDVDALRVIGPPTSPPCNRQTAALHMAAALT
jgi:hypothetical protein